MATSHFQTTQYPSSHFVESAGAILFHRSSRRICLLHRLAPDEYLLPKGRRNVSETCPQAALREVTEETGLACRLLPVTFASRAPPAVEVGDTPDEVRVHRGGCGEPFMVTCRSLEGGRRLKVIMWFIAEVDEGGAVGSGEEGYVAELFGFEECVERLTFQTDREIVERAIGIYRASYEEVDTS